MDGCRIGVGRAELTPTEPGPLCGWGPPANRKAKPPEDDAQRLHATAVALEDQGGERVVFVNADLHCGGPGLWAAAAEAAGLDRSRVVVCGTHTHAGPGQRYLGSFYTLGASASPFGIGDSTRRLARLVAAAVTEAVGDLRPGGAAIDAAVVAEGGNNRSGPAWCHYDEEDRQAFFADGPGSLVPADQPEAERMRDPRVTVLTVAADDGPPAAVLAWYAIHPNALGPRWAWFGADVFGWARDRAEAALGGTLVGFGGGSSGDISPRPVAADGELAAGEGGSRPDRARDIGRSIGDAVATLVPTVTPGPFSLATAFDDWDPGESGLPSPVLGLAMAGGGIDGVSSEQMWEEVGAGIHSPRYQRRRHWAYPPTHGHGPKVPVSAAALPVRLPLTWLQRILLPRRVPVHVIRVGDHAFASVPGEPTTMTGWRIEQEVQARAGTTSASVIGFANDYTAYWTTPEEYLEQRYEAAATLYGRQASSKLIERLGQLAESTA